LESFYQKIIMHIPFQLLVLACENNLSGFSSSLIKT
jgi:hypothetical protein